MICQYGGGGITFNSAENWHFDPTTAATGVATDFYTIALHEIGHALGLAAGWNQLSADIAGSDYSGAETLAAYNADNGTALTSLDLVDSSNFHFQDATYTSEIFAPGAPNLIGTVGLGAGQDLLMEPIANFVEPGKRRFELTNTDVAQLRDLGWSTISAVPEPGSAIMLVGLGSIVLWRKRRQTGLFAITR